jgi:HD-GYP domain-containing protein (c-di-GMP phosphodiesterase class II)
MKEIPISELKPGNRFDKDLYLEDDNIFSPAGFPIKEKDIERLKKWGVDFVFTDGERMSSDEVLSESLTSERDRELFAIYSRAVEDLEKVFIKIQGNQRVPLDEIDLIAMTIFDAVRDEPSTMVSFTLDNSVDTKALSQSSINCMIYSILIGINMKIPSHRLIHLALGALLHDVGMKKVPEKVIGKSGNLHDDEKKLIQTHTVLGYTLITRDLKYPDEIGQIALQHHERWDGKGYPRGLSGKNIALPARIVSVADAFEAMVSERPYRNSMIGYTAMRQLLNDNSRRFDSDILKIFIKSMGIYPLGSLVLLNNSAIAKVEEIHPEAPLRPGVRVVVDENGKKLNNGRVIDLINVKELFIARAIDPKMIVSA